MAADIIDFETARIRRAAIWAIQQYHMCPFCTEIVKSDDAKRHIGRHIHAGDHENFGIKNRPRKGGQG